jgi:uncharacterized protein (DUF2235 family)
MAKTQLVVLCDGTWNDPASSTNVWLTYLAICDRLKRLPGDENGAWDEKIGLDRRIARRLGEDGATVIAHYDSGVGTEKGHKLSGGSLGLGLSENVRQAYEFIVDNYVDDAEIYVFGFSRGAYTVRSLCGFIKAVGGLLSQESLVGSRDQILLDAYELYRTKPEKRSQSPLRAQIDALKPRPITIRCLGVYDTVGALGVPIPALALLGRLFFRGIAQFHDTVLSSIVENAFQALAIDERRGPFVPALWTAAPGYWKRGNADGAPHGVQRVLQVWFAGAHADVGGGYQDRALADISLGWMLRRAIEAGLELPDSVLPTGDQLNPLAERHDSFRNWRLLHKAEGKEANILADDVGSVMSIIPFASLLNYGKYVGKILQFLRLSAAPRIVGGEQTDKDSDRIGFCVGEYVHESVKARCTRGYLSPILDPAPAKAAKHVTERVRARRPVHHPAALDGAPVELVDLSGGGALVTLNGIVPAIDKTVKLKLPSTGVPCALKAIGSDVDAKVVWSKGNRVGLTFAI